MMSLLMSPAFEKSCSHHSLFEIALEAEVTKVFFHEIQARDEPLDFLSF